MPTIFSHAIFAAVSGKAFVKESVSVWFWLLTALCAMIPDADVVGRVFGVQSGTMFAHRGFTHSFVFACVFGCAVAFFTRRFTRVQLSKTFLIVYFSLATFSHPVLDMLTNGGSGVALLAPFSNERFFFPWRPVEVSPIGLRFFSDRGWDVIASEIIWLWIPAFVILAATTVFRRLKKNTQ